MATIECPTCPEHRPMDATASICRKCAKTLDKAIANVGAYYVDLDTLRTAQVRLSGSSAPGAGGNRFDQPELFERGGKATIAIAATRSTVVTWVRVVLDEHPPGLAGPICDGACLHVSCGYQRRTKHPRDNVPSCVAYLRGWVDWFRTGALGEEILRDMLAAERMLRQVVDRPADRWYAGQCSAPIVAGGVCQQHLYAVASEGEIECPACGTRFDIPQRRAFLLESAEEYELTAQELARAVTVLDDRYDGTEKTLAARIRKWAERNQLLVVRHHVTPTAQGAEIKRPLYRVRDVLDLLAADARHAESKRRSRCA